MTYRYLFADEAGCFAFKRGPNISRYFILCTVTMTDLAVVRALEELRHELVWADAPLGDYFHCTADKQEVRDRVFETLQPHRFSVQATICEKAKAQPQVRASKARFYKYPWFYHFRHGICGRNLLPGDRLLVTAAALGNRKERATFTNALDDVMVQNLAPNSWAVDFRPSQSCYGLQVADYCAWAIQRYWEQDDDRSYRLIADRINYEYDLWRAGKTRYY
jgi:hypothetical protein